MKKIFKNRYFKIFASIYLFLWLLTAIWGNYDVSKRFRKDFQYGYKDFSDEKIEIIEINSFYVYDLNNKYNADKIPEGGRFRYRSVGIPIAPFIIVDNFASIWASLAGLGATRINIWFFGFTWWYPIICYWAV